MATKLETIQETVPKGKVILKVKVASEDNGIFVLEDCSGKLEAIIVDSKSATKYLVVGNFLTISKPNLVYKSGTLSHIELTEASTVMTCKPFALGCDKEETKPKQPELGISLDDVKDLAPNKVGYLVFIVSYWNSIK